MSGHDQQNRLGNEQGDAPPDAARVVQSAESTAPSPSPAEVEVALALVSGLSREAKDELLRALRLHLYPPATARERHEAELRPLAEQLRNHGVSPNTPDQGVADPRQERILRERAGAATPRETWPVLSRDFYDENAPDDALSSAALLKRHNTRNWSIVCKAAASLPDENGTRLVAGATWAHPTRGREGPRSRPSYTRDEAIDAVLACAKDLDTPIASLAAQRYIDWSAAKRRKARANGQPDPRLPTYEAMRRRFFPGGWSQIKRETVKASQSEGAP